MRYVGLLLLPAPLLAGCALMGRLFPPDLPEPPQELSAAAIRLPGGEAMAAGIALEDMIKLERAETAGLGGLAPDGGVREVDDGGTVSDGGWQPIDVSMAHCYQEPSTYEVWVELDATKRRWKVVLVPTAQCARHTYGGGGFYEIDANSLEILHRERFE